MKMSNNYRKNIYNFFSIEAYASNQTFNEKKLIPLLVTLIIHLICKPMSRLNQCINY